MPIWWQGPIIQIDIADEDDTLGSDDDVAGDSAVAESDSDED